MVPYLPKIWMASSATQVAASLAVSFAAVHLGGVLGERLDLGLLGGEVAHVPYV